MGDEVEISDNAVVVSQNHHFHAAESSQFQEDLPFLLSWAVDYCVLDSKEMTELVIEKARAFLLSLKSQFKAVGALLSEELGCNLADFSINQLFPLIPCYLHKH